MCDFKWKWFVISNRTRAARLFNFEITCMLSDQIALLSVQLPLCIGHELCQLHIKFVTIIIFFMCEREFLEQKLICTILSFFSYMKFCPFSCQAWVWLVRPAWLLSLFFFTMPGKNTPCETQSPSLSENEVCDKTYEREANFFMFRLPLFQLMNFTKKAVCV